MDPMRDLANASDDDLLHQMMGSPLTGGDEEAFTELYRRHQGRVYRFALHMSGNADVAEEVTQEVFMFLMRGARQYEPSRGSLAAFLIGVARKHVLRRLECERVYGGPPDEEHAVEHDLLGNVARSRQIECIRKALVALPQHYREVLVLCDLEEFDYAQTAEALGCPVGTVRSRLNRARAMLAIRLRSMERCPA